MLEGDSLFRGETILMLEGDSLFRGEGDVVVPALETVKTGRRRGAARPGRERRALVEATEGMMNTEE